MIKIIKIIILVLVIISNSYAQLNKQSNSIQADKNPGGIFLSPIIGGFFPIHKFNENSSFGFSYGGRLEFASKKIYPVIISAIYEHQRHLGKDEFETENLLTNFETEINSFGGSVDIILSKYLKTNFTIPFITFEVKYSIVNRTISPDTELSGILKNENLMTYSAGAGFTLYIFDIYGKYNYTKDYSSISINTKVHLPIIKF